MKGIDCAGFEAGLARALADPRPAADGTIEALEAHAAACAACRGAAALVELAASAADARDPVPDPGPAYWEGFERRLSARLRGERRARRRLGIAARLAVVAAAAAAAAAVLIVARRGPEPPSPHAAAVAAASPAPTPAPAPPPGGGIRSATPAPRSPLDTEAAAEDESAEALAWSPMSDPLASGDEPGLFPGTSGLTDEQQDRFAAWLAQETRRLKGGSA